MQSTRLTEENKQLQEAARQAQEQGIQMRSERDQLTYQLQETISARSDLHVRLDTAQRALNEARMGLASQEKETQLLTERLGHAEQKMEKLEQEKQIADFLAAAGMHIQMLYQSRAGLKNTQVIHAFRPYLKKRYKEFAQDSDLLARSP